VVSAPPSLEEFAATVREAFAFLGRYGVQEITAPAHRHRDAFQIWFGAGGRFVVVAGEGHGTMASVTLEHNGRFLSEIDLVPANERPAPVGGRRQRTQLEQVREAARRLERHGGDFLAGDVTRFLAIAKPLPPYKQRLD
jgi:hypothetical protein